MLEFVCVNIFWVGSYVFVFGMLIVNFVNFRLRCLNFEDVVKWFESNGYVL